MGGGRWLAVGRRETGRIEPKSDRNHPNLKRCWRVTSPFIRLRFTVGEKAGKKRCEYLTEVWAYDKPLTHGPLGLADTPIFL